MTRQQDIEKRVRKFLADQERNRFTRPMEAAFMAFLDLALDCGEFDDFKSLVEGVLFLAINDNPEHHDQAGAIQAQIILF